MSKATEHAQSIADKLAQDRYGKDFSQLSADIQDNLFSEARLIADTEITKISQQRLKEQN